MKLRTKIMSAVAVLLLTASCSPGLGRENPVPNPNPDHGAQPPPTMTVEDDCEEPYLVIEIAVLAGGPDPSRGYAARPVHITVTSTTLDGRPVEFTDDQGNRTINLFQDDIVTPAGDDPYRKCFTYQPGLPFADVGVVLLGQEWDWMRMEITRYDNPDFNLCVDPRFGTGLADYAQVEIGEGQGNTAALNCIVPLIA